jgi:hypothetical protein
VGITRYKVLRLEAYGAGLDDYKVKVVQGIANDADLVTLQRYCRAWTQLEDRDRCRRVFYALEPWYDPDYDLSRLPAVATQLRNVTEDVSQIETAQLPPRWTRS